MCVQMHGRSIKSCICSCNFMRTCFFPLGFCTGLKHFFYVCNSFVIFVTVVCWINYFLWPKGTAACCMQSAGHLQQLHGPFACCMQSSKHGHGGSLAWHPSIHAECMQSSVFFFILSTAIHHEAWHMYRFQHKFDTNWAEILAPNFGI